MADGQEDGERRQPREDALVQATSVALTYVDLAGVARVKTVPWSGFDAACRDGVGMSPVFDAFLTDDSVTSSGVSGGPMDDLRLRPDRSVVRWLAPHEGWLFSPVNRFYRDGSPYALCTRTLLARQVERLGERGLSVRCGIELEWVVGRSDVDDFVPATRGPAYGLARVSDLAGYLRDLYRALEAAGLAVVQIHPEYAPGQFELSLAARTPLETADESVLARAVVRAVGLRHGLRTSFAPVVDFGGVGNGGHVHLSVAREGVPIFAGGDLAAGLRPEGASVIAWLLEELPGLLAIAAPHPVSYLRLVPSHWAGSFRVWGIENREAALRLIPASTLVDASSANLELKCADLAANPYLLLAAVLAVVEHAVAHPLDPPKPIVGDPVTVAGAEPLPERLEATLAALEASSVLTGALGDDFVEAIGAVRRAELARFQDASPDELVAAMRWGWS